MESKSSPPEMVGVLRFYACSVEVDDEEEEIEDGSGNAGDDSVSGEVVKDVDDGEGREDWSGDEPVYNKIVQQQQEEESEEEEEEVPPPPYSTSPTTRIVDSRHIPSDNHKISTSSKQSRYFSSSRRSVLNKPTGRSPVTEKAPENISNRISVLPLKYNNDTDDIKPSQQLWFTNTPTGWISGTSPTKTPPPEPSPVIGRPPVVTMTQRSPSPPPSHISHNHSHNHSHRSYVDDAYDEDEEEEEDDANSDEHTLHSLAQSHRTTITQLPTCSTATASTTIDLSNLRMSTASFLSHNLLFDQQSFRTLKVLILRNNGLDDLKALHLNTKVLPCLVDIDLAYNHFTGTPLFDWDTLVFDSRSYPYLTEDDLAYNHFTGTVPSGAFPPSILCLDLSYNRLDNIDSLGSCLFLQTLMVQNNSLRFLGCLPPQLQTLDLSNNLLADRLNLRLLSLCPRLKLVRIVGNPTAERQAIASRVTITSVLPALEQLDDLLLPGRKVRRRKASPLRPPPSSSSSGTTIMSGSHNDMTMTASTAPTADAHTTRLSHSPEGVFQLAFPDAAASINACINDVGLTNGHNIIVSPTTTMTMDPQGNSSRGWSWNKSPPGSPLRESSESLFGLSIGPLPATSRSNTSYAPPLPRSFPVIRLNKKYIDANQHRLNKQAHKRDHELKRMEEAVHAQARRMEVKLTPEAARELVARLYDKSMDGLGYDKLRSRVTDAVGALRERHFSRHPQQQHHQQQHHHPPHHPPHEHLDTPTTRPIATDNSHFSVQPEIGGVSVFLPLPVPQPLSLSLPSDDPATTASAATSNPPLTKRLTLVKSNAKPQTIDLDDFLFDEEGCYVEANDLLPSQPSVGPADGVFDDNFLLSFPAQPTRRIGAPVATQSSLSSSSSSSSSRDQRKTLTDTRPERSNVRHTDKGLSHQPLSSERSKLHNAQHTQALAQPKRRTDVSSRDFPSSRPSAATTTGHRDNSRKRVEATQHQRGKDKDKGHGTLQNLPLRTRGVRPGQQGNAMSPPPPPPPLYDLPVSPVSLKSAVFQFADVYPKEDPETTHVERNEGRREEVDADNNDQDWIEVAEELLAQTPIDGSGRDEQLVLLMQLLAQANELAASQSTAPKAGPFHSPLEQMMMKKKAHSPSPSPQNIALSPSHPDHPSNPRHHTPPASPDHSIRIIVEHQPVTGAGDASPFNRSGSAVVSISMNDDSPQQTTRSRKVSDVSLASIEILEMFPKWKNAAVTAGNISNNPMDPTAPNIPPVETNKGTTQGEFVAHCAQALNQTLSPSFTSPSRTSREGYKHRNHHTTPSADVKDVANLAVTPELPKKALLQWKVRRKIAELGAVIKDHYKDMENETKK